MLPETDKLPPTVMVVDDDPDIRGLIQLWLADCGYRVVAAADGAQALDRVKKLRPSLIILDMMMPHMDGAQVAQRLRADPQTSGIPIVVVSADPRARDRLRHTRIQARLAKPFDLDELLHVVERHLPN